MSALPSHIKGYRETVQAGKVGQQQSAERVWTQVAAERRAVDERPAKLRAAPRRSRGAEQRFCVRGRTGKGGQLPHRTNCSGTFERRSFEGLR